MLKEKLLINFLKRFDAYPFELELYGNHYLIGKGEPDFKVKLNKSLSVKDLLNSTSLTLGEAYMDKDLEIDGDLYYVLDHFLSQIGEFSLNFGAMHKLIFTPLSKVNQKEEVQSHYDIGNDFYELWLDDTLSYSCAYFENEDDTLDQAQRNKIDRILEKLNLEEGMTLLDIGCGWGFLLIEAAKKYGVKGLGITLSEEQYKEANRRIKEEGLEDQIMVRMLDYRDLHKLEHQFDRVVSVGMLEHVGSKNYQEFMDNVDYILKPSGLFLLHFISGMEEHPGDPWIKKYIFPGGVIPTLNQVLNTSIKRDFHVHDIENLRPHYRETLLHWLENFNQNKDIVQEKYGERFVRMWELYLAACAACFDNGVLDLHQILYVKGNNNQLPMTRWY